MSNIELKKIAEENFITCFNLQLAKEQEKYVSHPIRSLAQGYVYYNQCTPFGIYVNNAMVGYVMVIYDYDEDTYNLWHLMIDKEKQGKGYGKNAMLKVIECIKGKPFGDSSVILLTCNSENMIAYNLYKNLGFTETGRVDEDEVEIKLNL